jgi:hypothetical protein
MSARVTIMIRNAIIGPERRDCSGSATIVVPWFIEDQGLVSAEDREVNLQCSIQLTGGTASEVIDHDVPGFRARSCTMDLGTSDLGGVASHAA